MSRTIISIPVHKTIRASQRDRSSLAACREDPGAVASDA
jgi:hypothetical protein